jgi:hypothetical protein
LLGIMCTDSLCWGTGRQISLVDKTQEDARQKLKYRGCSLRFIGCRPEGALYRQSL